MTEAPASAGVIDDFAHVYAAHHAEALRLAYLLCRDPHRAEDVVADAFVNVYRRWRARRIDAPRAYIRRAVVNEVSSKFRRLAIEQREATKRSGDERGARATDEQVVDAEAICAALSLLPARQRAAIVLRYYLGLSEREVAEAMGVSVGTVKSAVSRGLERMRRLLGEDAR